MGLEKQRTPADFPAATVADDSLLLNFLLLGSSADELSRLPGPHQRGTHLALCS